MQIKIALLKFINLNLKPSELHLMRGYIGNLYREYDLIHNHAGNGHVIARYPLIQFKIIGKIPAVIAISEKAIEVLSKIFLSVDHVDIKGTVIPVYEKDLKVENSESGFSEDTLVYEFNSPWLALNEDNYRKFKDSNFYEEKKELLEKILTANILSMSKGLGIYLSEEQKIKANLKFSHVRAKLKGINMSAFTGIFKTNYIIPDYLGLGKSSSRGFGTVKKLL